MTLCCLCDLDISETFSAFSIYTNLGVSAVIISLMVINVHISLKNTLILIPYRLLQIFVSE
jgi:hypothetical protein